MNARVVAALLAAVALAAGCSSSPAPPTAVTVAPATVTPAGAHGITAAPARADEECDREASLRPGPQPAPGAMPAGSTMAAIAERGRLIVGVDQNTYLFGFRDPSSGQLEGFDIDVAREIARAIFGDPDRIDLKVVDAGQRESALTLRQGRPGGPDLLGHLRTQAKRRLLDGVLLCQPAHPRREGVAVSILPPTSPASGCARSTGTTSLSTLFAIEPRPTLVGVATWTDCLVMLQQGQVDAISTDDVVLAGLAAQDPNVEIAGPQPGDRALRRRHQEGPRGSGPVRQRCPGADACRRNVAAPLRRVAARASVRHRVLPPPATRIRNDGADPRPDGPRDLGTHSRTRGVGGGVGEIGHPPGPRACPTVSPSGRTADRWVAVESALAQMWDGLRWMTSIMDAVHALRARRSKPDRDDVDELTRLLRERPLTVSPEGDSLDRRVVGGLRPAVERVGLADTADRIRAAYPAVAEFLAAVDDDRHQGRNRTRAVPHNASTNSAQKFQKSSQIFLRYRPPIPCHSRPTTSRRGSAPSHRRSEIQVAQRAEDAFLQANWSDSTATTGAADRPAARGTGSRLARPRPRRTQRADQSAAGAPRSRARTARHDCAR